MLLCFRPKRSLGIVLNEAMAAGVPVITTDRGSIRTLVGNGAGLIVDDAAGFVEVVVRQVVTWIDSPQVYVAASEAAVRQADYLHREAASNWNGSSRAYVSPHNPRPSMPQRLRFEFGCRAAHFVPNKATLLPKLLIPGMHEHTESSIRYSCHIMRNGTLIPILLSAIAG